VLFERSYHVYANAFIAHDDVAETEYERLIGVHQVQSLIHGEKMAGVCRPPLEPAER
jgi:hypothetical protein